MIRNYLFVFTLRQCSLQKWQQVIVCLYLGVDIFVLFLVNTQGIKMNQSFNVKELRRLYKRDDFIEYKLVSPDLELQLESAYQKILDKSFDFDIKQTDAFFLTKLLEDKLILRKLNDNIRCLYKDKQTNRRIIISQIQVLLGETCPCWIIKTDIKRFYESIDRDALYAKFKNDSMPSYYSMFLLGKVFSNGTISSFSGVPRGMNISAVLSEIYMRKFDRWIKECAGVFYYARFVDDIIIFTNQQNYAQRILESIKIKLKELASGLTISASVPDTISISRPSPWRFSRYPWFTYHSNGSKLRRVAITVSLDIPLRRTDAVAVYRHEINLRAGARLVSLERIILLERFSAARVSACVTLFADRAGSVFAHVGAFAARAFQRYGYHGFPPKRLCLTP